MKRVFYLLFLISNVCLGQTTLTNNNHVTVINKTMDFNSNTFLNFPTVTGGLQHVVAGYGLSNINDSTLKADSATLSGYYLRLKDSVAHGYYPYSSNPLGYLVTADISGKLNISDTSSMLSNYFNQYGYSLLRSGQAVLFDSATAANYFLRRKDSTTYYPYNSNPLGYLTSASISGKLNISDTAAMLQNYYNQHAYGLLNTGQTVRLDSATVYGYVRGLGYLTTAVDTIYRTAGKDSIQFTIGGRYHAILDSLGGGSSSSLFPTTGTGTATGAIIGELASNTLFIKGGTTTIGGLASSTYLFSVQGSLVGFPIEYLFVDTASSTRSVYLGTFGLTNGGQHGLTITDHGTSNSFVLNTQYNFNSTVSISGNGFANTLAMVASNGTSISDSLYVGGKVRFSSYGSGTHSGTPTYPLLLNSTGDIIETKTLPVGMVFSGGTISSAPITFTSGSNLTSVAAGAQEFDGNNFFSTVETTSGRGYIPSIQIFRLTSNGSNISTIANFFGSTSNITLVSGAEYIIEIDCYFTNSTAGTVTWTFTNSAAPTSQNIHARFSPVAGIVAPEGSAAATYLEGDIQGDATAAKALTASGTLTNSTTQWAHFSIHLYNGTGTSLKIQATKSSGTITPLKGSYWICTRVPAANTGTFAN